jgi:hypothetical protein
MTTTADPVVFALRRIISTREMAEQAALSYDRAVLDAREAGATLAELAAVLMVSVPAVHKRLARITGESPAARG